MWSKVLERRRLLALALVAAVLALFVYQRKLRVESWIRLPASPAPSPPDSNFTAAIVYLAERGRLDDTLHSLGSLQLHIPWRSQWPIVLFHTGDFDDHNSLAEFYAKLEENEWTKTVHSQLRRRVEFVRIEFTFPPGVSPDIKVYKPKVFDFRWPGKLTNP